MAAHQALTRLARRRAELDGLEGPALLRALRAGVHRHLGLGSFAESVERLFGTGGHWTTSCAPRRRSKNWAFRALRDGA
jgi:hypothetical protein